MTYDANGNLTTITDPSGVTTFTWDARNRLIGLDGPGLTVSFAYDALGRRVAKEIDGELTEYLYDGADIIEELTEQDAVTYLRSLNIDEPLVRNGTEYYLTDALGSILGLADPSGALATRYTYEPFGETAIAGPLSSNPFQYTGRENDGTGLYYYRARYYHPGLQRFISEDPLRITDQVPGDLFTQQALFPRIFPIIRLLEDHNPYPYALNNPLFYVDPDGQHPVWVVVTTVIVLGSLATEVAIHMYCAISHRCKEPGPQPHIEPVPLEPPFRGRRPPPTNWPPVRGAGR